MLSRNGVFRAARGLKWIRRSGSRVCVTLSESHRVVHDRQQCRFTVRLEHGGKEQSAVLEYAHRGDGRVHLVSTQVPECVRGRGVAAGLAKAALDFVVEEGLKARISCWYIKKYVEENPHHGYHLHIED